MGGTGRAQAQAGEEGVSLNFDRADIREAAKVILGDVLHKNYTVDPQVNGEVTLSTTSPLAEADLLAVFESMLRANAATLITVAPDTFEILPLEKAPAHADIAPVGGKAPVLRPGFGITVVPLRNISATAAAQFIQPLVSAPEDIRIDAARNLLLFAGTQADRQSVVNLLADLDVNWLADKSVGLFPLHVSSADSVIPELQQIFGSLDPNTPEAPLMKFVPVPRLNAILAVGTNPGQIEEVERWVARLDRGKAAGTQFYVYNLKHAAAEDAARLLNDILSEQPASASDTGQAPTGPAALSPMGQGAQGGQGTQSGFGTQQGGYAGQQQGGGGLGTGDESQSAFGNQSGGGDNTFGNDTANGQGGQTGPTSTPKNPYGVKLVANRANNSLLIRATPQAYQMIEGTLGKIDTAPAQVLVEASIVEVQLNDALRYGVQYFIKENSTRFGFTSSGTANGAFGIEPTALIPGFNFIFTGGNSNITIDALARLTNVKVLSSPSVVVQDNRIASLTVGQEVPIQTQSQQAITSAGAPIVNSIEYRNTGVILQVRPRINVNGVVTLLIAQEVSRVDQSGQGSSTTTNLTPTITQRKITSQLDVLSGQTVVLGGLIEDTETRNRDRIPILGELPIIGTMFGTTDNENARTELIVFLTPRVIRNADDARDVSEELRARLKSLRPTEPEAALPPVPTRDRPPPPEIPQDQQAPYPAPAYPNPSAPRPVVPPGTLGPSARWTPAPRQDAEPDVVQAARIKGVPEAWLPDLVGAAPRPKARPEPPPDAEDDQAAAPGAPVPVVAPSRATAAAAPPPPRPFDLAKAPVPQNRPVAFVPAPPRPRPDQPGGGG